MPSLGDNLKDERIKRGINLKDLERITKIRSKYLLAIEKGEFDDLPGTAYVRAFIKSYANALGLDAAPFLEEFTILRQENNVADNSYPQSAKTSNPININRRMGYSTTRIPRERHKFIYNLVAGAIALIIFMFIFSGLRVLWAPDNGDKPPVKNENTENRANPKKNESKQIKVKDLDNSALIIKVKEPGSWVRVTADGKMSFEGILQSGESKEIKGKKFIVRAGNAGCVLLWLNNKSLGKLGEEGEVVEKTFSSNK